jgi:hypothetical protein
MTFSFPAGLRRPVDKALFLAEAAIKEPQCQVFLARAEDTMLPEEPLGPHTPIQLRLVVLGLDDKPVEALFLQNNFGKVVEVLKKGEVLLSLIPKQCREARTARKPKAVELEAELPPLKKTAKKSTAKKPAKKRGRPRKTKKKEE